jgi:hypothetical protein
MIVRQMNHQDMEVLKVMHKKFYSEFDFPGFLKKFLLSFVIEDDDGNLILGGGIQPLAEALLVTNQDMSRIKIGKALVEAQQVALHVCRQFQIDELVAFVKNEEYANHLIQHGFSSRPKALGMKV